MKKTFLIGTLCLLFCASGNAQTFSEWFRQKKTQRKYLLQQIAALQVYIGYAQKGYDIAEKGVHAICDIKKGDFSIHDEFISALKKVNPAVGKYAKVADIIVCQLRIIKQTAATAKSIKASGQFTADEWKQYAGAIQALLKDCDQTIESLILIITNGELGMGDAERLKHIDRLYLDVQAKFAFSTAFTQEAKMLCRRRLAERTEIDYSKKINGLK